MGVPYYITEDHSTCLSGFSIFNYLLLLITELTISQPSLCFSLFSSAPHLRGCAPPAAAGGAPHSSQLSGLPLCQRLLVRSSWLAGSAAVAHGLGCPAASGTFRDPGSQPSRLH